MSLKEKLFGQKGQKGPKETTPTGNSNNTLTEQKAILPIEEPTNLNGNLEKDKISPSESTPLFNESNIVSAYVLGVKIDIEKTLVNDDIKPKFVKLTPAIKRELEERLFAFNAGIQEGLTHRRIEGATGYILDIPFECYDRVNIGENEYGKTIILSNKYIDVITRAGSSDLAYKEEEYYGDNLNEMIVNQRGNTTQIRYIRNGEKICFEQRAEKATTFGYNTASEFITYAQPLNKEEGYLLATGIPKISCKEDLENAIGKEGYIITIKAKDTSTFEEKEVRYLYNSQEAYIKGDKPYMIYVSRNR